MKICLFDHHNTPYPIKQYGGIERVIENLFKYLVDNDYDVTLIINDNNEFGYKNGKVIQLPFYELENIRYGRKNIFNDVECDIFHTHTSGIHQNIDFRGFRGKWVSTCHGFREDAAAEYLVFISESQYNQHVLDYNSNLRSKKCYICYNGVDTNTLYPTNKTKDRIIWFSGIRYEKNAHILSEFAKCIGEKIYIYGNIQDQNYFDGYIKPYLNNLLEYCGPISGDIEKREMFNESKLYIHTTYEFKEPFGLSIMEAQACGVPVVGFNSGSLPEIVYNSKNNLSDSFNGLVDIINSKKYITDENLLIEWVNKRFTYQKMGEVYTKIYKHILQN
jgi:glycosyltransferase involved in cell wall biosynthesis